MALIHLEPGDPRRCEGLIPHGQCPNEKVTGMTMCHRHGGKKQEHYKKLEALNNYRLTKWHQRIEEKKESTDIKSLRDEIAILRMVLEERLERCTDAHDLILQSGPISDMVMKIERVVSSCHKLEGSMGYLMDKQAVLQFAQVVIQIVGDAVPDERILTIVADKILEAVAA